MVVLGYGVMIMATWCSNSSSAVVIRQANGAFTACHKRSMGLSSGLEGGQNRHTTWAGSTSDVAV